MSVLPHPHHSPWSRRAGARRLGGVAGNERLTAMTAVVLVALLLAEAYTLTSSGDGGWDLEVSLDLPGSRERSIVECKRWKRHRVGVQIVRQLAGAWRSAGATKRILVTTSTFTRPARKEAAAQPQLGPPGCDASRLRSI